MPTKQEILLKYSILLIVFIGVMLLSGQNGTTISCGLASCCQEFQEYFDAMHDFSQYFDYMDVEPSCGYIANKEIERIKIGFNAPVTPGTFSIGGNIISEGKDLNGQIVPGLAFYSPQFIDNNRVIVLPIVSSSIIEDVTYRITLKSSSDFTMIVGGEDIIGKAWIEFTVKKKDSVPPYIVSMSSGLSAPLTRAEYLSRPPKPIDAVNVEPHSEIKVIFSEKLNFTNVVPSREARLGAIPGLELITVPYMNPSEEVNFVREDTGTETVIKSQTIKGLLPGIQYAFDFVSCGSGCVVNCVSGSQDLSGWYLVPCLGSECADLKVDDWRSFTTSKVRIDSPVMADAIKKYATRLNALNVSGIITKDLSGSVALNIEGTGVSSSVPITVTSSTQAYNTYLTTLNVATISEGEYKLKATAPDGGTDSIGLVIDRTSPVVSVVGITPSYGQYVGSYVYVEVSVNETGSGISSVTVNGQGTQKSKQGRYYTQLSLYNYASGSSVIIRAEARDYAGNVGVGTRTVVVDKDPPVLTGITFSNTYYDSSSGKTYIRGSFTVSGMVSELSGLLSVKFFISPGGSSGVEATVSGNTFAIEFNLIYHGISFQFTVYTEDNLGNWSLYGPYGPYIVDNTPPPIPYLLGNIPAYTPNQAISFCFYALGYSADFSNDNFDWSQVELNVNGYPLYYDWSVIDLTLNWLADDIYRLDICFNNLIIPAEIVVPGLNNLEVCTLDRVGNASCNSATGDWYVRPTIDWISQNYGRPTEIVDGNVLLGTEITISGWGYGGFDINTPAYDYITIGGVPVGPGYIKSIQPPTQYQEGSITFWIPEYVYSGQIQVFINGVGSGGLPFTVCLSHHQNLRI